MVAPESSASTDRPPAWVEAVEFIGNVSSPVLDGVRGDLTDRRARWAVTLVRVGAAAGTVQLRRRYPRPVSADQRLVAAAMKDARTRDLDVAELYGDPEFRAAQARLNQRMVRTTAYAVSVLVTHRLLLAELKRRGVRRPHLVAGIGLAAVQTARRVGSLVAERRQR